VNRGSNARSLDELSHVANCARSGPWDLVEVAQVNSVNFQLRKDSLKAARTYSELVFTRHELARLPIGHIELYSMEGPVARSGLLIQMALKRGQERRGP
jgi:hypothetical protein